VESAQSIGNRCDDAVDVVVDLGHREPQHAVAHMAEPAISPRVIDGLIAVVVAVDFDHQPCLQAGEVGEVGADGNLASKLAPHQLPAAQAVPEAPFGPGHPPPQLLAALIPSSPSETGLTNHASKLSPAPRSHKQGR
jgi:hypothetical protein